MRIIHVVETLAVGGQEQMVCLLSQSQMTASDTVAVICLFATGPYSSKLKKLGVPVFNCDLLHASRVKVLRKLKGLINQLQPDVIHTHNPIPHYYTVLASLGTPGAVVINTRHGMGIRGPSVKNIHLFKREILFGLSSVKTDSFVTVCAAAKQKFERKFLIPQNKIKCIPNGITIDQLQLATPQHKKKLCFQLGVADSDYLIGTVGRIDSSKNQLLLVRILFELKQLGNKANCVIVGDGSPTIRSQILALAEQLGVAERLFMLGQRDDVPELLAGLDVFVLPSISEGYSIALLEACGARLPIIATDVGGNSEIISHNKTGLLFNSGDFKFASELINKLIQQPDFSDFLAANARGWVEKYGNINVIADHYRRLYERKV